MKRMRMLFVLMGLALCCWLVWRQARRPADADAGQDQRAMDAWQESIRLDSRTDYRTAPTTTPPELAEEEARQRPQEGRN